MMDASDWSCQEHKKEKKTFQVKSTGMVPAEDSSMSMRILILSEIKRKSFCMSYFRW